MALEPAPFDIVEASRHLWLGRWDESAASGMTVFAAILRSYEMLRDQVDAVLRRHHLTFARYSVLAWITDEPSSPHSLSWISKTLRMPPATLTNVIDHLESKGLIQREPHPSDARTTLAITTPRGRELSDLVTSQLNSEVYSHIALPVHERDQLTDLLRRVRAGGNDFDVEHNAERIRQYRSRLPDESAG
jgi:DNA-binding MarR family transcriptional regulator